MLFQVKLTALVPSSSGLGRLVFIQEITGSTPVGTAKEDNLRSEPASAAWITFDSGWDRQEISSALAGFFLAILVETVGSITTWQSEGEIPER